MSLLHYPQCLLSCLCNNHPYLIVFISVLFNTLRELMQACGFAGAGKQCNNINLDSSTGYTTCTDLKDSASDVNAAGNAYLTNKSFTADDGSTKATDTTIKIPKPGAGYKVNGSNASCNKLITLSVMMFCVFTGDGYLQHYRRCCRDCWPTTGYNASHYLVLLTTSWNNL